MLFFHGSGTNCILRCAFFFRYLSEFLPLLNNSVLDVLTYHRYIGNGIDPDLVHKMMQPSFLDQVVSSDLQAVHTKYAPSAELWVGEGAAAWHSGQDGATNAFASSFWWSNALGALSANNHTHYCRQVGRLCCNCHLPWLVNFLRAFGSPSPERWCCAVLDFFFCRL